MKVQLKRLNNEYHFETVNERGHKVHLDNKIEGVEAQGASPMELLLMGIAGCSGIDIIMILKKQHIEIEDLQMEVDGTRKDDGTIPNTFTNIHVKVFLKGDIPENKAKRAAELSFETYCSVAKMLEKAAEVSFEVHLNGSLLS